MWLLLVCLLAVTFTFVLYVRAEKQIDRANDRRHQSIMLADELRQSSDDLTNMVRSYAVTGEPLYKAHFQEILDIRDGRAPRPLDYGNVYWDLVQKDDVRPRPNGAPVALLESMQEAGFTSEELAKLADAKKHSDDLTQIEHAAMQLVPSDQARAIAMLYDDAYRQAKYAIMRPIGEFSILANRRTAAEVHAAQVYALQVRYLLIALVLVLLALLGVLWRMRSRLASLDLQQYKSIVDSTDDAVISQGVDGLVTRWNPGAQRIFGYTEAQMLGHSLQLLVPPQRLTEYADIQARLAKGERIEHFETVLRCQDGRLIEVSVTVSPIVTDAGQLLGASVIARDVSRRKQQELELQDSEIRYRTAFMTSPDAINISSLVDGRYIEVSDGFERMTGWSREEAVGKTVAELGLYANLADRQRLAEVLRRDGYFENAEANFWTREGRQVTGLVSAHLITVKGEQCVLSVTRDITRQKEHERHLEHIAHYDALTGLPNRVLLADRLKQAMTQAMRRQERVAVAYLDLDGFKEVNDQHGHQMGDQLLIALANRMKDGLREGDTLARLGGDEFVVVLLDTLDPEGSMPMLNRILSVAAQPVQLSGISVKVSASMGVTYFPQGQSLDAEQLMRQADQAMYQAKLAGKNRCQVFDATQDSNLRVHHESLERIRVALEQREFVLHYQPKVNMRTGALVGVEALIRWQHSERGLLPPALFLPVIEDHDLALDVGDWVIQEALAQAARWQAQGLDIPVSVNVGARQLQQPHFMERLQELLLQQPSVDPSRLQLEILETSALDDVTQVSELIAACARIGVTFALDDFGTGYSSLTYLRRLKVELLKIDRSFVRDMLDDADDLAILEGVIGLAAAFGRQVIAEGVETVAHGCALLRLGCDLAQGFGIAKPMPATDIAAWAQSWTPDPQWSVQESKGTARMTQRT